MSTQTRRKRRITLGVPGSKTALSYMVKSRPAKKAVKINGAIEHALRGAAGVTIGCAFSNCILDNAAAFPHPVLFAAVSKCKVLVVSKVDRNGHPTEAVEYQHPYGHITDANDTGALKEMVREQPAVMSRPFTLGRPAKRHDKPWATRAAAQRKRIRENEKHSTTAGTSAAQGAAVAAHGAMKRAVKAGLIQPDVAAHLAALKNN